MCWSPQKKAPHLCKNDQGSGTFWQMTFNISLKLKAHIWRNNIALYLASTLVSITRHHGPAFSAGMRAPRDYWRPFSNFLPFFFLVAPSNRDIVRLWNSVWLCAVGFFRFDSEMIHMATGIKILLLVLHFSSSLLFLVLFHWTRFLSEQNSTR